MGVYPKILAPSSNDILDSSSHAFLWCLSTQPLSLAEDLLKSVEDSEPARVGLEFQVVS